MLCKKFRQKNEGQAVIEFTLGLLIVISFFFFYIRLAAAFAIGNYIHYATFMSARAYSSSAANVDAQKDNATQVLRNMVSGKWKAFIKPIAGGDFPGATIGAGDFYNEDSRRNAWNQGTSYSYQIKISLYPWSRESNAFNNFKLTSESWMLREESADETCVQKKPKMEKALGSTSPILSAVSWEWDNGC